MKLSKDLDNKDVVIVGVAAAAAGWAAYQLFAPRNRIVRIASGEVGNTDWRKYLDGVLEGPVGELAWCGIFALWVLHEAGIAKDVSWEPGKGFLYRMQQTSDPKPGDIAYVHYPFQHHAIVEKIENGQVHTIDGNTLGAVRRRIRPLKDITGFYDTSSLG